MLFSMTGAPGVEEIKGSSVTSRVNPGAGTGSLIWGRKWLRETRTRAKPPRELRNFSKASIFAEMGPLGHVTRGEHWGNSLRLHLGRDPWGITGTATHSTRAPTSLSSPMADIANPSPHSGGVLLSAVFWSLGIHRNPHRR